MNTILKLGVFSAIGLLVWGFLSGARNAIANFTVDIIAYGKPTLRNYALTIPLKLRFNNPTPVPISIERLVADIYVLKNDTFVKGATINQPLQIPSGVSDQLIYPAVNLEQIFGGNVLLTAQFVTNLLNTKQITIRVDYTPIIQGVALPVQTYTDTLPIT